ncbi:MAG: autotransporter domain-containing protein [Pseudomonadota bacterium]
MGRVWLAAALLCGGLGFFGSAVAQRFDDREPTRLAVAGAAQKGTGSLTLGLGVNPAVVNGEEFGTVTYTITVDRPGGQGDLSGFVLDGVFTTNLGQVKKGFQKGAILANLEPGTQSPVDSQGQTWSCTSDFGTLTCTPPSGTLIDGVSTFTVTAGIGSKGPSGTVDLQVGSTRLPGIIPATTSVTVLAPGGAELSYTAAANPVNPAPQDPVDLEVTVQNTSAAAIANPFTVSFFGSSGIFLPTSFGDSNFSCTQVVTDQLDCDYQSGSLLPGAQVTLRIPVTAPFGAQPFSTSVNVIPDVNDTVLTAGPLTINGDTSTLIDFSVTPPTNQPVAFGDPMEFVATVTNSGPAPARNVFFDLFGDDNVFSGTTTFVSGTGANWNCMGLGPQNRKRNGKRERPVAQKGAGVGSTCDYGIDLLPGQTTPPVTIIFNAPSGQGVNLFSVFPDAFADNQSNSSSPTPIDVVIAPATDLSLTKVASLSSTNVGNQFTYSLTVTNNGPVDIDKTEYTITDTLPPEVSFVSGPTSLYTCVDTGGTVVCNYTESPDSLLIGGSDVIDLVVTATGAGSTVNTADLTLGGPTIDTNLTNNTDTANVVIAGSSDLSLAKTASAASVDVGSPFSYTLTVSNAGPDTASAFTVTDTLPTGVSYDGFSGAEFSCTEAAGAVTCTYSGAGLANGATTSLNLNVTAQSDGLTSNSATVDLSPPAVDPTPTNDTGTVDVTINPGADLALTKSASVSTATVGDLFDWVITVTNNGPAGADGFTVTDTLPTQTSFSSVVALDYTCTTAASDISCTWAGTGPLPNAGTSQITVTVDAVSPGTANNTATVSAAAAAPDTNPGNNSATASVVVNAPPMTTIVTTLADDPDPVEPQGQFTFSATLTNQGPVSTSNLFAVFSLDPGVTFNGSTAVKGGGGWSCTLLGVLDKGSIGSGNTVDCFNPGPLPVNTTTTVTLDLTAPEQPGIITTDVEIGSDEFGPDLLSETTRVGADVDLSISKTVSQEEVEVGEEFSFSIGVSNALGTASGISVSDAIAPQLMIQSISGRDWSCQQFQNNVGCDYLGEPLAADSQTPTLTINVRAVEAGQISNTARVSSDQNDVNPSNDRQTVQVNVGGVDTVDLVLTKRSLPETVAAGQQFQYLLTVENLGPSQATGVVVSDQLPDGVQFVSGGAAGWTCTDNGGLVQCVREGNVLPQVGPDTLTLTVQAPSVAGQLVNTADVTSDQPEANQADNSASAITTVADAGPDVAISKTVDQTSARRGDLLTYAIDVTNLGDEPANGVTVTDTLPLGLSVAEVTAPNWDCQVTPQSAICTLMDNLAPGASAPIILTGRLTVSSGLVENRVTVTTLSADPITDNNAAAAETTVIGDPLPVNLSITIDDSVDPVLTEEPFDYLITLGNEGPGAASEYAITGDLPPGVVPGNIVAPDLVSCSVEGQRFICRSEGLLPPNTENLITLSVTAPPDPADLSFVVEIQFTGAGIDEDGSDNTDSEQTSVRLTPTAEDLEQQLTTALGEIDDPLVTNNLAPTAELCANPPAGLVLDLCREIADALGDGRGGEVAEVIRAIVGAPTTTQHTSLVEASTTQFSNLFARFNQNRQNQGAANGGTFNVDGLAFRYGNEMMPLSFMQAGDEEPAIDSSGLIKPWAFFINGTISGGDRDPTTRELGFDFDTRGITMGVDYRFSPRFIGGAALGYSNFDSDIQGGGTLESDTLMLHLFANYYPTDRLYIDGLISFGNVDFDQVRPIDFSIGGLTVDDTAMGATEADMLAAALSVGYNYNSGSWNFTPSGSISLVDADIDAFSESGTDLALDYTEQSVESLILSANLSVSKIISLSRGILTPTFDVSYLHETSNDDSNVNSQILGAPAGASFLVEADSPDTNYASAGLGLVFVGANGKQAFLQYRNILGLSGFSRWTVNAGVRFEF